MHQLSLLWHATTENPPPSKYALQPDLLGRVPRGEERRQGHQQMSFASVTENKLAGKCFDFQWEDADKINARDIEM